MLRRPPDWTEQAACAGKATADDDPWTPTGRNADLQYARARIVCAACPVRLPCALWGLDMLARDPAHSMLGGLRPDELRKVAKSLGRPWQPVAEHGTRSRYVAGCADGANGGACDPCKLAHREYEAERRARAKDGRGQPDEPGWWAAWRALDERGPLTVGELRSVTGFSRPHLRRALAELGAAGVLADDLPARASASTVVRLAPDTATAPDPMEGSGAVDGAAAA